MFIWDRSFMYTRCAAVAMYHKGFSIIVIYCLNMFSLHFFLLHAFARSACFGSFFCAYKMICTRLGSLVKQYGPGSVDTNAQRRGQKVSSLLYCCYFRFVICQCEKWNKKNRRKKVNWTVQKPLLLMHIFNRPCFPPKCKSKQIINLSQWIHFRGSLIYCHWILPYSRNDL